MNRVPKSRGGNWPLSFNRANKYSREKLFVENNDSILSVELSHVSIPPRLAGSM